jgi:adenylate cyclase
VFHSAQLLNVADPYAHPLFNPEVDRATGFETKCILCMPIVNKSGVCIGVTQVLNKRGGKFTGKDEARLRAFTAQIAVSLENARLFEDVLKMKNYNESILRSTSEGMITLDGDRAIVTANAAAAKILLSEEHELVGQPAQAVFGETNQWVIDAVARVEQTGQSDISVDAVIALPTGEPASVNLTVVPLRDATEDAIGSMVILEDISAEKRVKSTMARYMSKEVVDQLLEAGEDQLGGKDQKISVLFSDVRSFTTMSESMGARETVSMLNEYFATMVDVIFNNGGILDKYIGDAIMALFGAPFGGPHDADNALTVANEMMLALKVLNVFVEIDAEVRAAFEAAVRGHVAEGPSPSTEHASWRDALSAAIADGTSRLLLPALEREWRRELTDTSEEQSFSVFSSNLRQKLLQPPLKGHVVAAIDRWLRT